MTIFTRNESKVIIIALSLICLVFTALPNSVKSRNSQVFSSFYYSMSGIKISEIKRLNFGTILAPQKNVLVKVDTDGRSKGNATFLDRSQVSEGMMKISGSSYVSITIVGKNLNTYSNVNYKKILVKYPGYPEFNLFHGMCNLSPPGDGEIIKLGGMLRVKKGTKEGDYKPAFVVEVIYD